MKITLSILLIAAVSSLSAQTSTSPGKRLLTEKDLFEFVWVADPELSPDGTQVAFTRVNCDEKRTGYETSIWLAPTNGKQAPMRMTNGKHDAQPRWSPDGKFLVFVRGSPSPVNWPSFRSLEEKPAPLPICRKALRAPSGHPTASALPL